MLAKMQKTKRYSSFDEGKLSIEDLRTLAIANGEPKKISGKQELYEMLINDNI